MSADVMGVIGFLILAGTIWLALSDDGPGVKRRNQSLNDLTNLDEVSFHNGADI